MRRIARLITILVVLVGLALTGRPGPAAIAQEGTPVPGGFVAPEGVTFEPIAMGRAEAVPPAPADFVLIRVRFAPGATFAVDPSDPGLAIIYVEAGTLTFRPTAPIVVTRAAAMATPGAMAEERVAADTEVTLGPGDALIGPPNSGGEFRNDGQEEVRLLSAYLTPAMAAATPTP